MHPLLEKTAVILSASALLVAGVRLQNVLNEARTVHEIEAIDAHRELYTPPEKHVALSRFLPIFGTPPKVVPSRGETNSEPEIPDFRHELKGVIASDKMRWAVLTSSSASSDIFVREGDKLGNFTVTRIHGRGIDITVGSQKIELAFSTAPNDEVSDPERITISLAGPSYDRAKKLWGAETLDSIYQGVPETELATLLRRAEFRRNSEGWVPR